MVLSNIDSKVANAIQGRRAQGVDAEHYVKYGDAVAIQQYPKLLDALNDKLPIPSWIEKYKDGDKTKDISIERGKS